MSYFRPPDAIESIRDANRIDRIIVICGLVFAIGIIIWSASI